MGKICKITKKNFFSGNKISDSNVKNKKKFLLNIIKKKIFLNNIFFYKIKISLKTKKFLNKINNYIKNFKILKKI